MSIAIIKSQDKPSREAYLISIYIFIFLIGSLLGTFASAALNQIVLWVLGPILTFYIVSVKLNRLNSIPTEFKLYFALIPISFLGLTQVEHVDLFFRYAKVLFSNAVFMLIIFLALESQEDIRIALFSVFLSCLTVVGLSFFLEVGTSLQQEADYRLSGIAGNSNGLATFARVGVILALYYSIVEQKVLYKVAYFLASVFMFYAIILSASRGNFGNVVFSVLLFINLKKVNIPRIALVFISLYFIYFLFLNYGEGLIGDTFMYKRLTKNESVEDAIESESRIQIYIKTFDLFANNPLTGVGLNQIAPKIGHISHTDWLDIAAQLGIIGIISYASIYFKLFRKIVRNWKINNIMNNDRFSSLFFTIFLSELAFGLSNPNWFFQLNMLILGITIAQMTTVANKSRNQLLKT